MYEFATKCGNDLNTSHFGALIVVLAKFQRMLGLRGCAIPIERFKPGDLSVVNLVSTSTVFQDNVAGPGASCVRAAAIQF
jgi:hypothetical protein